MHVYMSLSQQNSACDSLRELPRRFTCPPCWTGCCTPCRCLLNTKKNLRMLQSSIRQRWFKQTSVFCAMLLESFSVFFFCKTPGCCLQPSGHSPTQSRFVKCRTDCCLSRKFSCSSQGNAVVQLDRSLDLSHLHCRGPLLPVTWFVVRNATLGRQLHSPPPDLDIHVEPKTLFQRVTLNSAKN